jgi:hypothetical protein
MLTDIDKLMLELCYKRGVTTETVEHRQAINKKRH